MARSASARRRYVDQTKVGKAVERRRPAQPKRKPLRPDVVWLLTSHRDLRFSNQAFASRDELQWAVDQPVALHLTTMRATSENAFAPDTATRHSLRTRSRPT